MSEIRKKVIIIEHLVLNKEKRKVEENIVTTSKANDN